MPGKANPQGPVKESTQNSPPRPPVDTLTPAESDQHTAASAEAATSQGNPDRKDPRKHKMRNDDPAGTYDRTHQVLTAKTFAEASRAAGQEHPAADLHIGPSLF